MRIMSCLAFLLLALVNFGLAERFAENPRPFNDRHNNVVELKDYRATYRASGTRNKVPIYTRKEFDVSRMETDYQRSYVLLFGGQFRGRIGDPPGNLYVLYTDEPKVCNGTIVAYEVIGDLTMSNFSTTNMGGGGGRNNDLELSFGRTERIIISRGAMTNMLKKIDRDDYYNGLYCREARRNGETKESGCTSNMIDIRVSETLSTSYDSIMEDIMKKHGEFVRESVSKAEDYIGQLERRLSQANKSLQRCSGLTHQAPVRMPESEVRSNEFQKYLDGKFSEICYLKNAIRNSETIYGNVTVAKANEWKMESEKCLNNVKNLKLKLKRFQAINVGNRFGGEDDNDDPFKVLDPIEVIFQNVTDYSCIPENEITKCASYIKSNQITTLQPK